MHDDFCTCVCFVCMYQHIYISIYLFTSLAAYVRMYACARARTHSCMHARMHARMYDEDVITVQIYDDVVCMMMLY